MLISGWNGYQSFCLTFVNPSTHHRHPTLIRFPFKLKREKEQILSSLTDLGQKSPVCNSSEIVFALTKDYITWKVQLLKSNFSFTTRAVWYIFWIKKHKFKRKISLKSLFEKLHLNPKCLIGLINANISFSYRPYKKFWSSFEEFKINKNLHNVHTLKIIWFGAFGKSKFAERPKNCKEIRGFDSN